MLCVGWLPLATSTKPFVTVTGQVRVSPSHLAWRADLTLLEAIIAAGGLSGQRYIEIWRGAKKIAANSKLIRKGAEPDPSLWPGDFIVVQ